ncbi:29922_t:CDS:2 [Racocetra persica]|uniref:29922_t:CDS:1 n=1 Tax=Racocetra persica TaxID=160502 RepID=A0ACA9S4V3_9GLOM|nr:29922_t:CDS:2 [Racocetra persica]
MNKVRPNEVRTNEAKPDEVRPTNKARRRPSEVRHAQEVLISFKEKKKFKLYKKTPTTFPIPDSETNGEKKKEVPTKPNPKKQDPIK